MKYKEEVLQWARQRDLLKPENVLQQYAKTVSELGELGDAIIKKDADGIIDGLGDTVVTLIILSAQLNLNLEECLGVAYREIASRKGKTVDGTFIKE
jgi:NTP pyrophosphatase (non-canonical NTP hydrolase)